MFVAQSHPSTPTEWKTPSTEVMIGYTVVLLMMYAMFHSVGEGAFSAVLTMSVMCQCLAVALLGAQSVTTSSAKGISAKALILEILSLASRLSSTTWLDGYLPVDKSGDFLFQLVDVCSLIIALWLLRRVLVVQKDTYQEEEDTFPIAPVILFSCVIGIVFHADMDDRPLFDALWMAGLFMGVAQVLPQLWLITKNGRESGRVRVEAYTSHYIAALAVSRFLSGIFMWHAHEDITSVPLMGSLNHAPWVILLAHAIHLLLLADFAYYYVKSMAKGGITGRLDLPIAGNPVFV